MQIFIANESELELGELNEFESKHCTKVLRKKPGDEIKITNGCGDLFTGIITKTTSKKCNFELVNTIHYPKTTAPLHIAIAPTKSIDRFEFFIEKCIEIGISEITPMLCFHSERKTIKLERLNKIIISACKQSKNFHFPKLNGLTPFSSVVNSEYNHKLIAHCVDHQKTELKNYRINEPTLIFIGPEGDFSKDEIELALKNEFQPISLGESRLRTETAGIVACTIANLNYEK